MGMGLSLKEKASNWGTGHLAEKTTSRQGANPAGRAPFQEGSIPNG